MLYQETVKKQVWLIGSTAPRGSSIFEIFSPLFSFSESSNCFNFLDANRFLSSLSKFLPHQILAATFFGMHEKHDINSLWCCYKRCLLATWINLEFNNGTPKEIWIEMQVFETSLWSISENLNLHIVFHIIHRERIFTGINGLKLHTYPEAAYVKAHLRYRKYHWTDQGGICMRKSCIYTIKKQFLQLMWIFIIIWTLGRGYILTYTEIHITYNSVRHLINQYRLSVKPSSIYSKKCCLMQPCVTDSFIGL